MKALPFIHIFKCTKCGGIKGESSSSDKPDLKHDGALHKVEHIGMGYAICGDFNYVESYVNMRIVEPVAFF